MRIVVQSDWYSIEQANANPKNIYLFGDNVKRIGKGGQAQIRDCPNSYGIATKRSPSMENNAFFNDSIDDLSNILSDFKGLLNWIESIDSDENTKVEKDYTIIFPKDGLGTGLSQLPTRSPFINEELGRLLLHYFGIDTLADGTLKLKD